ncbi:MAG: TonB-dependent receptor, partial [Betaproteobacteria bacterium]|nr:TonB-dependent receptor [Betaproteobacteria bacterium]
RHARRTQGGALELAAGSADRGMTSARYGGESGDSSYWRAWGHARNRDGTYDPAVGDASSDSWRSRSAGFRLDSTFTPADRVTVSGEARDGDARDIWVVPSVLPPAYATPTPVTQNHQGSHLLGRWERSLAGGSEIALQGFVDQTHFEVGSFIVEDRRTWDLDFQHRLRAGHGHDLIWGLGYRSSQDDIGSGGLFTILPKQRRFTLASVFLHDDLELLPERLRLTVGARIDHNNFSGTDRQPSVRLLWTPASAHTLWGAVSHAVRSPSRSELDATIDLAVLPPGTPQNPAPLPVLVQASPSGNARPERLYATEFGYRVLLDPRTALDIAVFRNRYDHRSSAVLGTPIPMFAAAPPYILQPAQTDWTGRAKTRGVEANLDWRPLPAWRLQASYSRLVIDIAESSTLAGQGDRQLAMGSSPGHQASLRSQVDLSSHWQFDLWLRHIDRLDYGSIPAYSALDLRLGWHPRKDLELSLVGQNLLRSRHAEFYTDLLNTPQREIPRIGFVKAMWRF